MPYRVGQELSVKLTIRVSSEAWDWPKELRGKQFKVKVTSVQLPSGKVRINLDGATAVPLGLDSSLNEWRPGRTLTQRRQDDLINALNYFETRREAAHSLGLTIQQLYWRMEALRNRGIKIPPAKAKKTRIA